ncbi:MAG: hypothetical protein K2W92_00095 [Alphaproteobacteria bacterium]|nr:hypothetical protein [Alphaproteobacteria bacterium]
MTLKTLVILLSLSVAYSSAIYAMDPEDSSVHLLIRVEQAKIEEAIEQARQKFYANQAAVDQMHDQCVAADKK